MVNAFIAIDWEYQSKDKQDPHDKKGEKDGKN